MIILEKEFRKKCLKTYAKSLASIKKHFSTSIKQVIVDYETLIKPTQQVDLSKEVDDAFGNDGSGVLLVRNVPEYATLRRKILPYAQKLGNLPDSEKKKLELRDYNYHRGWNQGREVHNGVLDKTKASFYFNAMTNNPKRPEGFPSEFNSYLAPNVWPIDPFPEFESQLIKFSRLMTNTGLLLLKHIDKYVYDHYKNLKLNYKEHNLYEMLKDSENFVGRLLHYFPVKGENVNWLEWHYDHSLITALTSALFLDSNFNIIEKPSEIDPEAGLYINTRKSEIKKLEIPQDYLAFQIGEVAQILTGGRLKATAHYVNKGTKTEKLGISRNTLAVFMEPEWPERIYLMKGVDKRTVFDDNNLKIPTLESRFEDGDTFLQFSNKAFTKNQFY